MMLALGASGYLLTLLPLIYGAFVTGSVIALVWTFVNHRWSSSLLIISAASAFFGAALLILILEHGVTMPEQWLDLLIPIVPLICGAISIARLFYFRHERREP